MLIEHLDMLVLFTACIFVRSSLYWQCKLIVKWFYVIFTLFILINVVNRHNTFVFLRLYFLIHQKKLELIHIYFSKRGIEFGNLTLQYEGLYFMFWEQGKGHIQHQTLCTLLTVWKKILISFPTPPHIQRCNITNVLNIA